MHVVIDEKGNEHFCIREGLENDNAYGGQKLLSKLSFS
jgi:hypothetical protein